MKLEALTPMLRTKDLQGSVDFYKDILGFECGALSTKRGWASLSRDGVTIMLALPNAPEPFEQPPFTGSLYLRCDDVDAMWEQVKDRAKVCYSVEDFEYGMREFAIHDNNGYLLQFGQEIARD
jgi:uncharacterized glyoxalase superfamily protein PhnB